MDELTTRLYEKVVALKPGDPIDYDTGWINTDDTDATPFGNRPCRWTIIGTTGQFAYRIADLMEYFGARYDFDMNLWRRHQGPALSRYVRDFFEQFDDDYLPAVAWASNSTSSPLGHSGYAKAAVHPERPRLVTIGDDGKIPAMSHPVFKKVIHLSNLNLHVSRRHQTLPLWKVPANDREVWSFQIRRRPWRLGDSTMLLDHMYVTTPDRADRVLARHGGYPGFSSEDGMIRDQASQIVMHMNFDFLGFGVLFRPHEESIVSMESLGFALDHYSGRLITISNHTCDFSEWMNLRRRQVAEKIHEFRIYRSGM